MEQTTNSFLEAFEEKKNLGTLKTLTVLTFIGCGLAFLGAIWGFFNAQKSYETMEKLMNEGGIEKLPAFARNMYTADALEVLRKNYENRVPILIIYLVSTSLCLYGAIKMRQLKAEGFIAWLIGELLPLLGSIIFIGAAGFKGFAFYFGVIIMAVFIALYASQRKHLS
jgi:hypothetical protein